MITHGGGENAFRAITGFLVDTLEEPRVISGGRYIHELTGFCNVTGHAWTQFEAKLGERGQMRGLAEDLTLASVDEIDRAAVRFHRCAHAIDQRSQQVIEGNFSSQQLAHRQQDRVALVWRSG